MPDRRKVGFAVLLMLGATLCFAALDATSKHLSRTYPIPMMVWGRYTFHCVMMLIFLAPAMRLQLIATSRPLAQVTRALMLVGTTGFSMAGFSMMPLAESTAFLFVTPLVVVILSHWLLKESITGLHWIAVVAGFCGALLTNTATVGATAAAATTATGVPYPTYSIAFTAVDSTTTPGTTTLTYSITETPSVTPLGAPAPFAPVTISYPSDRSAKLG